MDERTEEKSMEGSQITAGSERSLHHKRFMVSIDSHHLLASSEYTSQI